MTKMETGLAQRWCALKVIHDRIETHVEKDLQAHHGISVREFSLLRVLSRQHDGEDGHLTMAALAKSVALSQSATTRLVSRLEERGLLTRYICATDRRGIYTDITTFGSELLEDATPTNDASLEVVLNILRDEPELTPFIAVMES
ncbi:MarR family winged helix-turn-helix transcriptional regulator [Corynebacterium crudilactis]|uniref:MarR family transcriptional regulator n=1 Tax=Corynebacterium crudilactis TaxID=1652495 RepID=A0A172QSF0_9CORY|nr:MarR family transcriptional regulator [Corynebacterium crudilactis]ANE03633.1 MarR family transcriptional regulator [Corynebacterium crudilactis]